MTPEERQEFTRFVRSHRTNAMSATITAKLAQHGLEQKLFDSAVTVDTLEEKLRAVERAFKLLKRGEWRIFR